MNTVAFNYNMRECTLKKPINTNVAKPGEKWELSQSYKEQEIMVPA